MPLTSEGTTARFSCSRWRFTRRGSDDARVARIEDLLSRYWHAAGVYDQAREHAQAALEAAERSGDERTVALTLAGIAIRETVSAVEPTAGLLERAVALEDAGLALPPYPSPSRRLGLRLMLEGRLDEARDRLTQVLSRVVDAGEEPFRALLLVDLTDLECRAGRWHLAAQHAADGFEVADQYGFEDLMERPALQARCAPGSSLHELGSADAIYRSIEQARHRKGGAASLLFSHPQAF